MQTHPLGRQCAAGAAFLLSGVRAGKGLRCSAWSVLCSPAHRVTEQFPSPRASASYLNLHSSQGISTLSGLGPAQFDDLEVWLSGTLPLYYDSKITSSRQKFYPSWFGICPVEQANAVTHCLLRLV